eukprot:NODE_1016_length_2138_cov_0.460520.p1 type:complete len:332 gc:universal NODE_1016_length_2138_cov_0.460520:398-1393(+)
MSRPNSPSLSSNIDANAYPFTCLSCGIAFSVSEQQRQHHSSDWHKYNLKRKINGLSSVGAQEFQLKVQKKKSNTGSTARHLQYSCEPCGKLYSSENAYVAHAQSKKHFENVKGEAVEASVQEKQKRAVKIETLEDKKKIKVDVNECIFCSSRCDRVEDLVDHMILIHDFFFPDIEYLTDIRGLLLYLGHKVKVGYCCIWCHSVASEEKGIFHSTSNVQQHMSDVGHCKLKFDDQHWDEYASFYDFSAMEEPVMVRLDEGTNEIVLENGKKLGHRSWHKYYKQHYSAIQDAKTRDEERHGRDNLNETRQRRDWRLKLGVKANSKKHFRDQII